MEFKCPQCGQSVETDESYAGQVARCPHCERGIVIPRGKLKQDLLRGKVKLDEQQGRPKVEVPRNVAMERNDSSNMPSFPTEKKCLKAWVRYWLGRLLIIFAVSFIVGFLAGFVGSLTGRVPFHEWPEENTQRLAHVVVYVALVAGIYGCWRWSWGCYRRFAIRGLFGEDSACNQMSSWFVPILVNIAVSMLMPVSLQLSVLGVYGYIVWGLTVWVVIDYCMFRFISVRLLCGQKIDERWICPAILFCIFIVVTYGFARIN